MPTTMKRNHNDVTPIYVCTWCKQPITLTGSYRTPAGIWPPCVGLYVCAPNCPNRPPNTVVYTHH